MNKADEFVNEYDRGYMSGYEDGQEDERIGLLPWGWFEFVVGLCMGAVAVRMFF